MVPPGVSKTCKSTDRSCVPSARSRNFVLIAGFGVGSCPYAFTYQPDGRFWRSEGHFLVDANAPEKKRTEEKTLERFRGRVAVREMEHEIAFLDMIRLRLVNREEVAFIFKPRRASLRDADGEELTLSYGEEIELDFGITERDWHGKKASLIAYGYYLPFEGSRLFSGLARASRSTHAL